ncbi:MAG: helix-turn-helix domain-containing protein [Candidatus Methylacidiphilales bacterium]|nr:AraC family transcriptional regulator [Candidatus Methylacidiphilales bacterium]
MRATVEHISLVPGTSFKAFRYAVQRFHCPYHYHPEVELTWIGSSDGRRLIGDDLADFSPGDLCLMGPGLPHTYFHSPHYQPRPDAAQATVVHFLPTIAGGMLRDAPEMRSVRLLLERSERGLEFSHRVRDAAYPLMNELLTSQGPRRLLALAEILAVLAADDAARELASPAFSPQLNMAKTERITRVCAWLTEHFHRPLTLEQAAQHAHMAPSAFSRYFHRATNKTFIGFVNELRIGHACRLLLDTEKSVSEIAFASGFENLSHFNRQFRSQRGATPRDYRNAGQTLFR